MKRLLGLLTFILFATHLYATGTVNLSGTIKYPDGTLFNGSLTIQMVRGGVRDSCNGGRIVPTAPVRVNITNGTVQGAGLNVTTSECTSPYAVYYIRLFDKAGAYIADDNWIAGATDVSLATLDIGQLFLANLLFAPSPIVVNIPKAIISTPGLTQTITQPATTVLSLAGSPMEFQRISSAPGLAGTNNARIYTDGTNLLASINGNPYFQIATSSGGEVTGTGTSNFIPKWSSTSVLTNSLIQDDGTTEFVGTDPGGSDKFRVGGTARALRLGIGAAADATSQLLLSGTGALLVTGGATMQAQYQRMSNTGATLYLGIESSVGGAVLNGSSAYASSIGTGGATSLQLGTNGSVRLTVDSSGNVGIGTVGPGAKLEVNSPSVGSSTDWEKISIISNYAISTSNRIYDAFDIRDGTIRAAAIGYTFDNTGYKMHFATAATTSSGPATVMTLDRSGSVTISGVGPHAIGGATVTSYQINQTGTFAGSNVVGYTLQTTLQPTAGTQGYGYQLIPTFTKAGSGTHSLLVGIFIQPVIAAGAAITTDTVGMDIATFAQSGTATNVTGLRIAAPTGGGTLNDAAKFLKSDGSTIIAQFKGSGAILMPNLTTAGINESAYVCLDGSGQLISDSTTCLASREILKDNIATYAESASAQLARMRVVKFNYKSQKDSMRLGFIADEVAAINPLFGGYSKEGQLRTYDDRAVMAIAVKALQEQQSEIQSLKDRIEQLERKAN